MSDELKLGTEYGILIANVYIYHDDIDKSLFLNRVNELMDNTKRILPESELKNMLLERLEMWKLSSDKKTVVEYARQIQNLIANPKFYARLYKPTKTEPAKSEPIKSEPIIDKSNLELKTTKEIFDAVQNGRTIMINIDEIYDIFIPASNKWQPVMASAFTISKQHADNIQLTDDNSLIFNAYFKPELVDKKMIITKLANGLVKVKMRIKQEYVNTAIIIS